MCYEMLNRLATRSNILGSLLLTVILLAVLGVGISPAIQLASGGLTILDLRITYTFSDALELFTALGSDGLALYNILQVVDTIFPLMYSITIALILIHIAPAIVKEKKPGRIIFFLPLIAAGFDYLENVLIASQMAAFPNLSELVISIAAFATWAKWVFMFLSFIILIIFAIFAGSPSRVQSKGE
jgi:hypothetical protein